MISILQNKVLKNMIIFLLISVLFCTSVAFSSAAEIPVVTVSDVECKAGETVTVLIGIKNNPGITTTDLKISYDSAAMSLLSVKNGSLLGGYIGGQSLSDNPYYCGWMNSLQTSNCTSDGTLATVQFKIQDNVAAGTYVVTVIGTGGTDVVTAYNTNLDEIKFNISAGSIKVKGDEQSGGTPSTPQVPSTPSSPIVTPPSQGSTVVPVIPSAPAAPAVPTDKPDVEPEEDKPAEEPQLTEEEKAELKKQEKLIKRFEKMTVKISSAKYSKSKKTVTLKYKKTDSGLKCPKYQIYRSTKKNSGYKKIYTTSKTTFTNKSLKKSVKAYYYKIRGIRDFGGKTYYTKWSNKVKVTIK